MKKKIVAGSYERFVWAWDADLATGELSQSFSRPSHLGPIKCAAGWGGDLVTGGSDDTIHIFDVAANRDVGVAEGHRASVTALEFFGADATGKASHLFSASEDGTICVWDAGSWIHFKTMKGGNAGILDLSIHSSGKLAISVERHGGFRMWNLLRGRCSFKTKVARQASLVSFLPEKEHSYAMACGSAVEIHNAEDGKVFQTLDHDKPVLCMAPFHDELLCTGGEDCSVSVWDFRSGKTAHRIAAAHASRVKGVDRLGDSQLLVSASSDGTVKVWDLRVVSQAEDDGKPVPLMQADTRARLTCVVGFSAGVGALTRDEEEEVVEMEQIKETDGKKQRKVKKQKV
ncbi:p21-activated protein kinase-interacting protein 1-like [Selaginella moellendorffii]|uniref:p21-activated protein kinase-interacting protein 1-like n=1 Tax=Selaginella moellendorffii TaxID=88036 RepID=UPI000D1CD802|nr:p21-activated protein kinase-interacting protein 1-like [Selaginella moellendorffii]|eukprot:XP_024522652.1 p21-activated protein kinase-interacting protein 1-like [Selaginella moellendorffii]